MFKQDLDGLHETGLRGVVQAGCGERPYAGGASTDPAVVGPGSVTKEGADVIRVVLASLVAGTAGADPRARGADRGAPAGEQRGKLRVEGLRVIIDEDLA